ncbi:linoleoyl phosphatidylcholine delta-12 acetylenase [Cylindrobasidium torrendii FP15055 ss-10]|uniref:Linoleoyl phosphatidylcholine delta-12 acetylenase n=1 Tax=Cylindrobasidium torrendii FP15055 ss-10 TaxID=1314674 RepID=A0A0D7BDW3_9AGAR|nr:linoleoyl phosphatidylcholine delta-12 acetylenase [Cylindrobasidium torrendii FP15055 ss-10]
MGAIPKSSAASQASSPDAPKPEDKDSLPVFKPLPYSIAEVRAAIPPELFKSNTALGLAYLARDIALATAFFSLARHIPSLPNALLRAVAWLGYWWFQGLTFTGIWVIGHECGHGAFSSHAWVNHSIGYVLHSALWTPYFSWGISHHRHHMNHASMERDQVYVPKTRSILGLPSREHEKEHGIDWEEHFGDTPVYTMFMLIRQQLLAFPAYLLTNVSGQPDYPKGTNHFNPSSVIFTPAQRNAVIMSNIGLAAMVWAVGASSRAFGWWNVIAFYGIPWLCVTHWFIMITYLQHTDPSIPHYRGSSWSFARGAAATVDRPFLGWQGRFFLHNVAHDHVAHHFFPKMPFYHGPAATKYLRAFLEDHYRSSDKNPFSALWYSYNECQFVEDDGDVLFYRNKEGKAVLRAENEPQ